MWNVDDDEEYLHRILAQKIVSFEDNKLSCSFEKIEVKMKNYHYNGNI